MTLFRYTITLALILLFRIISVGQTGPRWGVPTAVASDIFIETLLVAALLILGWAGCLHARKRAAAAPVYLIASRIMVIAVAVFFVFVVTTVAPQWKVQHPGLSALAAHSFIPGLILSGATFVFLSIKFK